MKKRIQYLTILVIALLLFLCINTLRLRSKQIATILPAVNIEVDDSCIMHLAEAIKFRTVSYADASQMDSAQFEKFISFLESAYPVVHSKLKRERINTYGLLYEWTGKENNLKPALLMGHYDVVPIIQGTEKLWEHKPFDGEIANGYIYGRGALDDKATVIGIFESVEYLLKQNYQPLRSHYLAFGFDEEVSGKKGAAQIAAVLESRKLEFEYVMDEGGTIKTDGIAGINKSVALIGIAEKGYTTLELTSNGEGGHSSMPPPQTSIGMLAEGIDKLQKNAFPADLGGAVGYMQDYLAPEMTFGIKLAMANKWLFKSVLINSFAKSNAGNAMVRTTIAPTIIQAGIKDNVLPIESVAKINFRILPGNTVESVRNYVTKTINNPLVKVRSLTESDTDPSAISDTATTGFRLIHRTIKRCFPDVIVAPYLVLGATDARHFKHVSKNIYRFMPVRLNDEDLKRVHGTNERISTEDFKNFIRFYTTLIKAD